MSLRHLTNRKLGRLEAILIIAMIIFVAPVMILHKFRYDPFIFLYCSVGITLFLVISLFMRSVQLSLSSLDIPIVTLILWVALSSLWATNMSLIWIHLFSHIQLFLFLIIFRSLWQLDHFRRAIGYFYFLLLGITFFQLFGYSIFSSNIESNPWHFFFGANENYVSTYCLALSIPVLIYFKKNKMIVSQLAYLVFTITLLFLSTSLGAAIGLLTVFIILYGSDIVKNNQRIIFLLFALILFIVLAGSFLVDDSLSIEYDSRLHMIKNSFCLFVEHPLLGIGAGNWKYEAYKFIPLDVLNEYHRLSGMGNHNLYSMVLSELGLVGIILLLSSVYMYVIHAKKNKSISPITAISILIFYLVCAFFYQAVWHYSINFSKLEVVAFCALGVLSSNKIMRNIKTNRLLNFCFLFVSLISVIYFYFFYLTSQACDNFNQDKIELTTKISGIERLYSSVFFNSCYHLDNLNYSLGSYFRNEGVLEKSEYYFREAYQNNPYDYNKNMQIAEFMFYSLNRKQESIEIVNKILKYEDIDRANLLLSNYLIYKSEYTKASILLAKPSINYSLYPDLLFQEIFEAEYSTLNFDTKFVWDFDSELNVYQNEFKDLILNHGLNSKEARKLRSSFKVYRNRFETYLKGKVSTENYIKYIEKRYKRYIEYEFLNISTLNKLDTVTLEKIEALIKQHLVDYKLGNSKKSKKVLQDKYLTDLRAIGVDKGYSKNIFNYY